MDLNLAQEALLIWLNVDLRKSRRVWPYTEACDQTPYSEHLVCVHWIVAGTNTSVRGLWGQGTALYYRHSPGFR